MRGVIVGRLCESSRSEVERLPSAMRAVEEVGSRAGGYEVERLPGALRAVGEVGSHKPSVKE